MRPLKIAKYTDPTKLRLHIYVVGYQLQGESILTVVAEGDNALLVIVTDSFSYGENDKKAGYNRISEILQNDWPNAPLDIFIWTHPHEDHSLGIKALVDTHDSDRNAHIFSPGNTVNFNFHDEFKKAATNAYNHLQNNYNREDSRKCHFVHHDPYRNNDYCCKLTGNSFDQPSIDITLDFLAPESGLTAECADSKNYNVNDLSIAYKLSVNGIDIFMGGDISKTSSMYIEDVNFQHINLIKIPHHASDEVGDFHLKFGLNECDEVHAASTIYRKGRSNLPLDDTLGNYKNLSSTVHCTGPKADVEPSLCFGSLHYVYDLYNSIFETMELEGNAYEFLPTGSDR